MPTISGTSVLGYQIVGNFLTLSVPQFELLFTNPPNDEPKLYGYFYINALDAGAPFQGRILKRGKINSPGIYEIFPGNYSFTAVRYSFYARWKVPGRTWKLNYQ